MHGGPSSRNLNFMRERKIMTSSQVPVLNFQDFISADGELLITDSRKVASVFGRRHDHVVSAIRVLVAKLPPDRLPYFRETVELRENPSGGAMIPSLS